MARKRERLEVIKDILMSIRQNKNIKPTRLLYASNLSPQMFKEYINEGCFPIFYDYGWIFFTL